MPRRSDDRIDELLAEGRLGGPARERVLGRVLDSLPGAAPKPGRRARRFVLGTFAAAGAVAAAVVIWPRGATEDAMRAKGSGGGLGVAAVTPTCGSLNGICRTGDRLLFRVEASPERAFMVAYADPLHGTEPRSDRRVWIFPTPSGESPEVVAATEPYVLRRAVAIDSTFLPGHYRLTIVLAKRALTRDEALRATDAVRLASTLVIE